MPQTTSTPTRDARLRRGWTLRELARRCKANGVSVDHGQISRIERGEYAPRPALGAVLAELLDLDAARDFKRVDRDPQDEPEAATSADGSVPELRRAERPSGQAQDVPELRDDPAERSA